MEWAALITWVLTAGGGFLMLALWLKHGGMQQSAGQRIRPLRILGHFALAAIGLVVWIVYLAGDGDGLAWAALALLLVVALLGFSMFATWLAQRRGGTQKTEAAEPSVRRRTSSMIVIRLCIVVPVDHWTRPASYSRALGRLAVPASGAVKLSAARSSRVRSRCQSSLVR